MPQESYELKRRAREQLRGNWLKAGIVCLIAWVLTTAIKQEGPIHYVRNIFLNENVLSAPPPNPFNNLGGFIKFILIGQIGWGDFLSFILKGPLTLGISIFFLKLLRNEGPEIKDLGEGIKSFSKPFALNALIFVFTTLWSLLLIIPGIIAAYRYSMAYYIMADNPQLSVIDALNQSKQLMVGNKFDFFVLELSFLGWYLLGFATLGLGLLWVNPYVEAAKVSFYQDLIIKDRIFT